jgi:hypothetical protein
MDPVKQNFKITFLQRCGDFLMKGLGHLRLDFLEAVYYIDRFC